MITLRPASSTETDLSWLIQVYKSAKGFGGRGQRVLLQLWYHTHTTLFCFIMQPQ